MKHMWSEEEIQALIEKQGGSGATLNDIVDSQGNKRFIEGGGSTSGEITSSYCKWSLSGTHIMFVVAGSKNDGTIQDGLVFATYTIPDWVLNKIVPIWVKIIDTKSINFVDNSTGTLTAGTFNLRKNNNKIDIQFNGSITLSNPNRFRIQFDLLIDTE